MQRKNCSTNPDFVLTDRSNRQLLEGAKHLAGRHRTVTAHLVAHLAEIYARKLHVAEGFPYLGDYCVGALGLSEAEGHRRAHAAVLAQQYPIILDMLLDGSIHLSTLREIGKCLTPKNHREVLDAARGKKKTELEHLAAALCPKPDVPTVLRKLPEPRSENGEAGDMLFSGNAAGAERQVVRSTAPVPDPSAGQAVTVPPRPKSCLAPLAPRRYNLQVTVDEETYNTLKQLQDLLRHQIRNGDLAQIIKDALLERLKQVERERFGQTKRPRKIRKQESWIGGEGSAVGVRGGASEEEAVDRAAELKGDSGTGGPNGAREHVAQSRPIAPGRLHPNSRHIPAAVKREVWTRDKGRCAFVGTGGRRCSAKGRLEFHHVHAYALGGPATVENIALRCRTHNAFEGVALFGEKKSNRPVAIVNQTGDVCAASVGRTAPNQGGG